VIPFNCQFFVLTFIILNVNICKHKKIILLIYMFKISNDVLIQIFELMPNKYRSRISRTCILWLTINETIQPIHPNWTNPKTITMATNTDYDWTTITLIKIHNIIDDTTCDKIILHNLYAKIYNETEDAPFLAILWYKSIAFCNVIIVPYMYIVCPVGTNLLKINLFTHEIIKMKLIQTYFNSSICSIDNNLYLIEGYAFNKASILQINIITGHQTICTHMPIDSIAHISYALNELIYVFGGFDFYHKTAIQFMNIYNPQINTWIQSTVVTPDSFAQYYTISASIDNLIFCFDNKNTLYLYNTSIDTWTTTSYVFNCDSMCECLVTKNSIIMSGVKYDCDQHVISYV